MAMTHLKELIFTWINTRIDAILLHVAPPPKKQNIQGHIKKNLTDFGANPGKSESLRNLFDYTVYKLTHTHFFNINIFHSTGAGHQGARDDSAAPLVGGGALVSSIFTRGLRSVHVKPGLVKLFTGPIMLS